MGKHPVLSGATVGVMEISVTYPLEFVKRQLQLQQQASALTRTASLHYTGPLHCAAHTVRTYGPTGLYVGFGSFIVFAGPKAALKFSSFEYCKALSKGSSLADANPALTEMACGLVAGLVEAGLGQTPNQAISTKMLHDASPAGAQRYESFPHAVRLIYAEHGLVGGLCALAVVQEPYTLHTSSASAHYRTCPERSRSAVSVALSRLLSRGWRPIPSASPSSAA